MDIQDSDVVMISSSALKSNDNKDIINASVPEPTPIEYFYFKLDNLFSNFSTELPISIFPDKSIFGNSINGCQLFF